mmetsp:Transcript_25130/g.34631  ORF Transcript_25130/g.34631 Transcript_25130/m.34631 type:complete len:256 (-) Transcript_25130:1060-1827(-)
MKFRRWTRRFKTPPVSRLGPGRQGPSLGPKQTGGAGSRVLREYPEGEWGRKKRGLGRAWRRRAGWSWCLRMRTWRWFGNWAVCLSPKQSRVQVEATVEVSNSQLKHGPAPTSLFLRRRWRPRFDAPRAGWCAWVRLLEPCWPSERASPLMVLARSLSTSTRSWFKAPCQMRFLCSPSSRLSASTSPSTSLLPVPPLAPSPSSASASLLPPPLHFSSPLSAKPATPSLETSLRLLLSKINISKLGSPLCQVAHSWH